jgi:TldD protein
MKMEKQTVRDIPRRKFLELSMKGGLLIAATPALMAQLISCKSGVKPASGMDMDKEMLAKIIAKALEKGGDFADVYLENRISRQIVMEESKFKSGLYGISQGAGVRVISGNKTGYAYTDDITEEKLLRAAEVASYVARNGNQIKPVNITEATYPSFITVKQPLADIADEKRIEIIKRADQAAKDYDPRIKMAMVDYNDEIRSRVVVTRASITVFHCSGYER